MRRSRVIAERVADRCGRRAAVDVLRRTYQLEKQWIADPEQQFPASDLNRPELSWFIASVDGEAAGVLRVLYDPPLALYAKYGFQPISDGIDLETFVRRNRIAEIGRFAVLPDQRGHMVLAAELMRVATAEVIARGYTHFVTDVFENDPHSPYGFHTRVMGFRAVATHDVGELQCASRRITMVLDLRDAYGRLKASGNWMYRYLTCEWDDRMHGLLAA
jgi:hypothetical protein